MMCGSVWVALWWCGRHYVGMDGTVMIWEAVWWWERQCSDVGHRVLVWTALCWCERHCVDVGGTEVMWQAVCFCGWHCNDASWDLHYGDLGGSVLVILETRRGRHCIAGVVVVFFSSVSWFSTHSHFQQVLREKKKKSRWNRVVPLSRALSAK